MLEFRKITILDKENIFPYITPYSFKTCEFSFSTLMIWKDASDIQYTIKDDALIIKKKDYHNKSHFMQVLGYNKCNLKNIVEILKKELEESNMDYLFKEVEESFILDLLEIYGDKLIYEEDRDNFDYIYRSEDLITMKGKVLHKKRNHYNKFEKSYNYRLTEIDDEEVKKHCKDVAYTWYKSYGEYDKLTEFELLAIYYILDNMELLNLKGLAVYVDDVIAGFSIGEIVNEDMAIIHFEKGDKNYSGVFAFINQKSTELLYKNTPFINREDDMGLSGLRIAKMSYGPVRLEKKYTVYNVL